MKVTKMELRTSAFVTNIIIFYSTNDESKL